jgi:cytochrome c551/c552
MKKLVLSLGLASLIFANDGAVLVEQNECKSCHNIYGSNKAPGFMGISRRNLNFYPYDKVKENIINSIKNGSSGKYRYFSDTQMPSFSNLSNKDLDKIATYILNLSNDMPRRYGRGGIHHGYMRHNGKY